MSLSHFVQHWQSLDGLTVDVAITLAIVVIAALFLTRDWNLFPRSRKGRVLIGEWPPKKDGRA